MYLVISFPGQRQEGTGNTGPYIKEQDSHFSRIPSRWWVENTYFISVVNSYGTRARTPSSCPRKRCLWAKGHLTAMSHFRVSPHSHNTPHVTVASRPSLQVWGCPASPSVPTANKGFSWSRGSVKVFGINELVRSGLLDSD